MSSRPTLFAIFLTMLALLAAAPATARPRDDVMSGAFRCAAIGDSHLWLDCYYGAAQPQRAVLGMSAVPAAQMTLVSAPPAGNVPPGDGPVRDAVLSGAFRCNDAADERAWLNCYYAAAQPMRSYLGLSPAPQAASQVRAASSPGIMSDLFGSGKQVPAQQFGMAPAPAPEMARNVDHVSARMASYAFDRNGIFTVTLANGQVWRQINGDTDHAHWKDAAGSYVVRVSRGFLGSYNLQVRNMPGLYKVLRLQQAAAN